MKKSVCIIVCALTVATFAYAFESPTALGFGLGDAAGNMGINLELSSPSFISGIFTIRAESQMDFLSAYKDNPDVAWETFSSHKIGIAAAPGRTKGPIRLYGEFGGLLVLPAESVSGDTMQWGIYGYFGFEFYETPETSPIAYYIECGTNSLFAEADKLPDSPDYYSGFTVRTGLRYYF